MLSSILLGNGVGLLNNIALVLAVFTVPSVPKKKVDTKMFVAA